ncbi:hypothetical protein OG239_16780 [Streptomyces sp. NBC_00868]|uniref:hypothetical protein n=1 Tax=unclassified Streptomyces TaxID=2593676 RepID=UPI0032518E8B|nr:hypothetical protein OG239_16780 [Streptomyces sp. NBC_00868]
MTAVALHVRDGPGGRRGGAGVRGAGVGGADPEVAEISVRRLPRRARDRVQLPRGRGGIRKEAG